MVGNETKGQEGRLILELTLWDFIEVRHLQKGKGEGTGVQESPPLFISPYAGLSALPVLLMCATRLDGSTWSLFCVFQVVVKASSRQAETLARWWRISLTHSGQYSLSCLSPSKRAFEGIHSSRSCCRPSKFDSLLAGPQLFLRAMFLHTLFLKKSRRFQRQERVAAYPVSTLSKRHDTDGGGSIEQDRLFIARDTI